MALTVLITRDVEDRYRGFLASTMLELAPGVYASPNLSARAREKIWGVLADWHTVLRLSLAAARPLQLLPQLPHVRFGKRVSFF